MYVLLANDHEVVRSGLKFYLQRLAPDVTVIEAATFQEVLAQASKSPCLDLIILDLELPGMSGLAGLELICARFSKVPVVVLSGSLYQEDVVTALARGTDGYLPKTMSGKAMLNVLQLVLSGEAHVPSIILTDAKSLLAQPRFPEGMALTADNPLNKLTPREREVLVLLTEGKSNKEIARHLQIREVTVKVHLTNVFRKLGATNRTQAVKIAMQLGWRA